MPLKGAKKKATTRNEILCGKQRKDSRQKWTDYREYVKKSRADSAARIRESYMKVPEKSAADSTAQRHESYKRDPKKSRADSAAWSKANYDKDVKASYTLKRQRYVIPCLCSFYVYVHSTCMFT